MVFLAMFFLRLGSSALCAVSKEIRGSCPSRTFADACAGERRPIVFLALFFLRLGSSALCAVSNGFRLRQCGMYFLKIVLPFLLRKVKVKMLKKIIKKTDSEICNPLSNFGDLQNRKATVEINGYKSKN